MSASYAGEQMQCVWPDADPPCAGQPEVRGLCHNHYMRAVRLGILSKFPAAEFFGDADHRRINDRRSDLVCACDIPRRGVADQCEQCGRLIPSADRVAELRAAYRYDDRARRWVRR